MRGNLPGLQYMPNDLNEGHEVRVAISVFVLNRIGV